MFEVTYLSAFIGGLLTFLAPCTLPLIPAFIAFIGGQTSSGKVEVNNFRKKVFLSGLLFVLGFTLVFVLFGLASGALGKFLILYKKQVAQVGGVIIILFGLGMLRIIPLPRIPFFERLQLPHFVKQGSKRGGFFLGALFGLGWSPCLGPVLGTILILAGTTGSATSGALLLFVYAMGLGLPFLLVALLYGSAVTYVVTLQKYLPLISRVGAVLMIVIGTLLLLGQFGVISSGVFNIYDLPWLEQYFDYM